MDKGEMRAVVEEIAPEYKEKARQEREAEGISMLRSGCDMLEEGLRTEGITRIQAALVMLGIRAPYERGGLFW